MDIAVERCLVVQLCEHIRLSATVLYKKVYELVYEPLLIIGVFFVVVVVISWSHTFQSFLNFKGGHARANYSSNK